MNSPQPAPGPAQQRDWTRRLVNLLVALVVIAVAAATFVFSYDGVHAFALAGGVSAQLARYYPGLFDAVLVIACVAVMTLRDGRWWWRLWAWAVIVVVLAAIGTTDVLHAMNYTLRHRATEGIVAAAPVVAVLLAFSLLLTMLRQSRARPAVEVPVVTAAVPLRPPATPIALPPVPAPPDAPTPADTPVTGAAPAREDPLVSWMPGDPFHDLAPPQVTGAIAPASPAAGPSPEGEPAPPTVAMPAPPTVQVPALPTVQVPAVQVPAPEPRGIRYADSGVSAKTADLKATASDTDYWDTEEPGQFAGLVYSAREERDADAAKAATDDDTPPSPAKPPEIDDDAPPFATAPFGSVPRLNRVRSTPTPPAEDENEDE